MEDQDLKNTILELLSSCNGLLVSTEIAMKLKEDHDRIFGLLNEMNNECTWFDFKPFGYGDSGQIQILGTYRYKVEQFLSDGGFADSLAVYKHIG